MKRNMDEIQFESRAEVREILGMVAKDVEQNPKEKENKTLERFYDLMDVMDMEW